MQTNYKTMTTQEFIKKEFELEYPDSHDCTLERDGLCEVCKVVVTDEMDGELIYRPITAEDRLQKAMWDALTSEQREELEVESKRLTYERD